jgi:2-aminobenzoate-CoA ligase
MNAQLSRQDKTQHAPGGVPSAHTDEFIYSMMPPTETWPVFDYSAKPLSDYPDVMNAAEILLHTASMEDFAAKPAFHYEGESWSYRQLQDNVDKIARVLVEDYARCWRPAGLRC